MQQSYARPHLSSCCCMCSLFIRKSSPLQQVKHTLVCGNPACSYKRCKRELFRDLSLCLPEGQAGQLMVDNLLEDFFSDTHLEYVCEKCGHSKAAASHSVFTRCVIATTKRHLTTGPDRLPTIRPWPALDCEHVGVWYVRSSLPFPFRRLSIHHGLILSCHVTDWDAPAFSVHPSQTV